MFNGEIIFHMKRMLKMLCYYKWQAWQKLLSNSGLKKVPILHISILHRKSFWGAQNIVHKNDCVANSKNEHIENSYFPTE